jgi:ubiquinone/menaquinone biosynthesis C-methylase UbiE
LPQKSETKEVERDHEMHPSYDTFDDLEREGWRRVADKYEEAWSKLTSLFIPALLDVASPKPGERLLDVASGPGHVAAAARSRGAQVIGVDFCEPMIERARERYPEIDFQQGDAQALEFGDQTFDIVTMSFGLLHLPRPDAGVREARRVLRPGGRFVFTLWAEGGPGDRIVNEAIKAHASTEIAVPSSPHFVEYANPDRCRQALKRGGFDAASIEVRTITCNWRVPTTSFLFEAERDAGVRTAAVLAAQTPAALAAIQRDIENAVRRYAVDGGFSIPFAAHVIGAGV